MTIELVDRVEWEQIAEEIDTDFGRGVTRHLLGDRTPVTMIRDGKQSFYLIPTKWMQWIDEGLETYELYSMGIWLGEISNDQLKLSISTIEKIAVVSNSKMIVLDKGAQSFTYGRGIIRDSVKEIPSDMQRGQRLLVMNQQGVCLGLGMLSVDSNKVSRLGSDRLVAKNLTDIGWYLRRLG